MALRNIRLEGDEILRKISKPVKKIDEKIITLLDDMAETMYAANGVGLAAPQIGVLKKVVVVDISEDKNEVIELINPEILEVEGSQINIEGCLSIPGKNGYVERPERMKLKTLDRHGNELELEVEGTLAIVFSHEIDHLNGVLYTDKVIEGYEEEDDDEEEE
ncbi:peptide deformylase [Anaeropeptidivorans aminofermentans]|uniref:peptide deformylase n=1 Tax=Anaeropeptidivorans aminofermentans TaxID=2934315 RepID=UPI002024D2F4|nr:peptide deformylase [Anaeropeptidivorans aminofermentans]